MPLADYAHWNEDAQRVWWEEEGRHPDEPHESYDDDYVAAQDEALDAFCEELEEHTDEELLGMLNDAAYLQRWPKAEAPIRWVLEDRGVTVPE